MSKILLFTLLLTSFHAYAGSSEEPVERIWFSGMEITPTGAHPIPSDGDGSGPGIGTGGGSSGDFSSSGMNPLDLNSIYSPYIYDHVFFSECINMSRFGREINQRATNIETFFNQGQTAIRESRRSDALSHMASMRTEIHRLTEMRSSPGLGPTSDFYRRITRAIETGELHLSDLRRQGETRDRIELERIEREHRVPNPFDPGGAQVDIGNASSHPRFLVNYFNDVPRNPCRGCSNRRCNSDFATRQSRLDIRNLVHDYDSCTQPDQLGIVEHFAQLIEQRQTPHITPPQLTTAPQLNPLPLRLQATLSSIETDYQTMSREDFCRTYPSLANCYDLASNPCWDSPYGRENLFGEELIYHGHMSQDGTMTVVQRIVNYPLVPLIEHAQVNEAQVPRLGLESREILPRVTAQLEQQASQLVQEQIVASEEIAHQVVLLSQQGGSQNTVRLLEDYALDTANSIHAFLGGIANGVYDGTEHALIGSVETMRAIYHDPTLLNHLSTHIMNTITNPDAFLRAAAHSLGEFEMTMAYGTAEERGHALGVLGANVLLGIAGEEALQIGRASIEGIAARLGQAETTETLGQRIVEGVRQSPELAEQMAAVDREVQQIPGIDRPFRRPNLEFPPSERLTQEMGRDWFQRHIRDENVDCSEIARDLYRASGDTSGRIIDVTPNQRGQLTLFEGNQRTRPEYTYHQVYSDGRYVYDPRANPEPIPIGDWTRMIERINPDGVTIRDVAF